MQVAITGATGFLGRYIVKHLLEQGHTCRCWHRPTSDRSGFEESDRLVWLEGSLGDASCSITLVDGVDAVVHAALDRPGPGFRGSEGDLVDFVETNVVGSIRLIQRAHDANVPRFVYISTCAVHEVILDDRPLDETHPLWPTSHYGAHKAAVEKFVHSFGLGTGYDVCALRPTGIYGLTHPIENSKWFDLVRDVATGKPVSSSRGGKEVHAADVAKAVGLLLTADGIAGQAYNCYDRYIADQEVAEIVAKITGSNSTIEKCNKGPKNLIETGKIRALGMAFGGRPLLEQTVRKMVEALS